MGPPLGFHINWTREEQEILEAGLVKYASETGLFLYAKIAIELPEKNVRDVAMRCTWLKNKEKNKRRKEDQNGSSRKVDKETIDMGVASNSVPYQNASSIPLREEYGSFIDVVEQNNRLFHQIEMNLHHSKALENFAIFFECHENIEKLITAMNEELNRMGPMMQLPELPERLSHERMHELICYTIQLQI